MALIKPFGQTPGQGFALSKTASVGTDSPYAVHNQAVMNSDQIWEALEQKKS